MINEPQCLHQENQNQIINYKMKNLEELEIIHLHQNRSKAPLIMFSLHLKNKLNSKTKAI